MHLIDALDHPPPATRVSPLERSYYLRNVSEQFNQASTHLSPAPRELDDDNHDLEASFPYDPSSQTEGPTILLSYGTENEDIFSAHSPIAQADHGSQPHDEFDAQDSSQYQQALEIPAPNDDASIFTEELVTEFQVKRRSQTQTQGRIPCFMCRQRFSNNRQALRHMKQCHFLNMIWVCETGSCANYQTDTPKHRLLSPDSRGNVFFRRDNFTSHLVVKHGVAHELKKDLAGQAEVDRCPLPTELSCSVPGCEARYVGGDHVLGDLLTHVTKDHPTELEGIAFRNALLPYLHSIKIVVRGPRGLRPVTHEDPDSG
ncbi:hypothetical protein N3K66_004227 [Trichothecium roseum]|uniref:Uncharacterized protein n=1 Tax=Trichothecium roseum TaxID=47278 RepID=A0ACC0V0N0_9HYPO|nr:hypothetical protein N3K66_004227 [Trichothecium roseum]